MLPVLKKMNMKKEKKMWAKTESFFDVSFSDFCDLTESKKAEINSISNSFDRYFFARTAATVNFMNGCIFQHTLYDRVIDLINTSFIEEFPDRAPAFLKSFYIVLKKKHPKGVKALWGFYKKPYLTICGERLNDSLISSLFLMDFENKKYDFGKNELYSNEGLYFIKFVLTFSLLLEAKGSPLVLKKENLRCSPSLFGKMLTKIHYVPSIQEEFEKKLKEKKLVHVRGFLKNQAVGKNWSERRIIYIAPFERVQKINKE